MGSNARLGTRRAESGHVPCTALLAALVGLACGDPGVVPPEGQDPLAAASLTVMSGSAQVDTIDATLAPIVLRITNEADGSSMAGVRVDFSLSEPTCGLVSFEASLTDAGGAVVASWVLGSVPRTCSLIVHALDVDGTPRLSATVPATILPGAPTTLDLGDLPVWVYVGEEQVAGDISTIAILAADRRGNPVPGPAVTWSFVGGIEADGDTIRPTREDVGWMIASVAAARDSVELWALDDLGRLGTMWVHERWERFHDGFVRAPGTLGFHGSCDGDPFDDLHQADDWVDSLRSSSSFAEASYSRIQPGLLLGFGAVTLTTWCSSGVVLEESGDVAMTTMINHSPGRLGVFPADTAVVGYVLVDGSADSEPYHTVETRIRPGG